MSRCLNCHYELAFLEKWHKFKCAKCSSIFTEAEIKLEEFKEYNKSERGKDKIESTKKRIPKTREEKLASSRASYQRNKEKVRLKFKIYYSKNRGEILGKQRARYKESTQNEARKARRLENVESTRLNGRIEHWKRKQKMLADSRFEDFLLHKVQNKPIEILPTYVLA